MQIKLRKSHENKTLWLVKLVAGALIFFLIAIHLLVNHTLAPQGLLTYADVVAYYNHPVIPFMEIAFLIVVVVHALLGLRSIILDLEPGARLIKWMNISLTLLGTFAVFYGIWLTLTIVSR